jgi:hypothetical protein
MPLSIPPIVHMPLQKLDLGICHSNCPISPSMPFFHQDVYYVLYVRYPIRTIFSRAINSRTQTHPLVTSHTCATDESYKESSGRWLAGGKAGQRSSGGRCRHAPRSCAADLRTEPRCRPAPEPRRRPAPRTVVVWGDAARPEASADPRPALLLCGCCGSPPALAHRSTVCSMSSAPTARTSESKASLQPVLECIHSCTLFNFGFPMVCRLELTNTFSLDIVVQGFLHKELTGRKLYVKGKTIRWNVNLVRS